MKTGFDAALRGVYSENASYDVEFVAKIRVEPNVYKFVISAVSRFETGNPNRLENIKIVYGGLISE
jgi:hypothetical protein